MEKSVERRGGGVGWRCPSRVRTPASVWGTFKVGPWGRRYTSKRAGQTSIPTPVFSPSSVSAAVAWGGPLTTRPCTGALARALAIVRVGLMGLCAWRQTLPNGVPGANWMATRFLKIQAPTEPCLMPLGTTGYRPLKRQGTFHITSLQQELHLIKFAFLRVVATAINDTECVASKPKFRRSHNDFREPTLAGLS